MATSQQFGNFDELLASSTLPLLVDFYAPWCGPCQIMAKVLEQVSPRVKDKATIVKINTDNYPALATQYSITALPTMIIFKGGQQVERLEGAIPADKLYDLLQAWF
jgi:thioredoxin